MALGAIQAIKEAGRDKEMWVFGGAGMKDVIKMVMDKDTSEKDIKVTAENGEMLPFTLRDHSLSSHAAQLHDGIEQLKAAGADVVLIDPQFAPAVLAKSETPGMVEQMGRLARPGDSRPQ